MKVLGTHVPGGPGSFAMKVLVRLNSLKLWRNNNTPHTAILDEAQTDLPLLAAAGDRIPKQFVFDKKYKIQLHEDDLYEGLTPKELRIFTDGFKTKSGTGSGVFSEDLNIRLSTPLGYHNSVFQAECLAISLATTAIDAREVKGHSMRILSDSMSVLQALNRHNGSRGNNAADELARRGSDTDAYGPEPIIPIPAGIFRSLLRERTKNEHNTYWTGLEDCRQAREAMPTLSSRLSKKLLRLKKPQLCMITSIITSHGHFNKHLSVIGVTDSPLCSACMEEGETAAHLVLHCKEVAT
ncbi:hypothetical protein NE865_06272 [Phthorimaea operculella]|nr:hypothetical protein NE865_06272 [Phthorimaea operculella]